MATDWVCTLDKYMVAYASDWLLGSFGFVGCRLHVPTVADWVDTLDNYMVAH